MRDLIRRDQEREAAIAEVQKLLDEGVESGVSDRSIGEVLESVRSEVRRSPRR